MDKQAKAEKTCETFNAANPIGTEVTLAKDDGSSFATKTRSPAYVCAAGVPVIFVEKVRGYYLLDRVRPVRS